MAGHCLVDITASFLPLALLGKSSVFCLSCHRLLRKPVLSVRRVPTIDPKGF